MRLLTASLAFLGSELTSKASYRSAKLNVCWKHSKNPSKKVEIIDWLFIGLGSTVGENPCTTQGDCLVTEGSFTRLLSCYEAAFNWHLCPSQGTPFWYAILHTATWWSLWNSLLFWNICFQNILSFFFHLWLIWNINLSITENKHCMLCLMG